MTTKTHATLTITFCVSACITIFKTGLQLIGFIHGPSDEKDALDQYQSVQTTLLALADQSDDIRPWGETADFVFETYEDVSYRDHRAMIIRDAGAIAAFFALILFLVPNLTSIHYSASQRLCFLLSALPIYITSGLVGQLVFQKTIPIEVQLLKTWGTSKGSTYIGYCSLKSLLIGLGTDVPSILSHDIEVVMTAGFLVFILLGLMPPEK
mmetsp:Transcript_55902/g.118898  ORF Transcript_55902/g.118898 Transcript_55902/m.118898 type:complete len:210 (-) Transcript_55902:254-883(-)|eukprot:CAMPEP_0172542174 /NCGR_PEP_ID=MMETSP1067-20121228/12839_1 /TAXON_ID=265564 ORGANISM="Thalassiosira punctigera, Strain Tpunct2005C2" /NCGR_SAMPLE_ID=MMETSP1067 /ASSEMBLY_ACC=CAM_ASM_000444 /LENGTH=209 /DNA_ID=CAMNT_0013328353 /DNA_START=97 /DNA_END=726 /DNA_ORIENTATION=-